MTSRRTLLVSALGLSIAIGAMVSCAGGTEPETDVVPSAATSTVSLSSSSVLSGSDVIVTLRAKDVNGTNVTTGGATVTFALTGSGTSSGTISAVTDFGNGTYGATFTGTTAGSARQFSATLNGAAVTTAMPSVTVTPGVPSLAQSTVETSASSIQVGATATLTLRTRDAAGNATTTGGFVVTFTKGSGTSDGTIGTVTDNVNGTYTATFTATTAGTARSIGANIGNSAVTSAAPTITVTPAATGPASAATSTVSLSASTVASGSSVTVTMQAKDASGANFTTGGETVAFSLAGAGTSTGTFSAVTDNGNGTYSSTLTGVVAGTARNVAATLNTAPVTTTQPAFSVTPGPVATATSVVTVSNANVVIGNPVTLTLTARDAADNALTAGGLTVLFTKGAGTSDGTIGTVTDNSNGTYTATFTATTAGTARSIGATIGGAEVTTASPTITVAAPVVSAATSVVTVNSATIQSGTNTTITLQAKEAGGANINVGGATVAFSLGGGTSTGTIGAVTDNNNGTYTATFTGVLVGTARSISATINGDAVTTTQPAVTVTPGAVSASMSEIGVSSASIASGTAATLTLTAKDAAGNTITTGGATVGFALGGGGGTSAGTIGSVTDNANGTYTATFTGTTAGTARSITAMVNSAAVTTTSPTITVVPGAISAVQSTVSTQAFYVAVGGAVTLTLTGRDAAGNVLTSGGATIAFTAAGGTSSGTIGGVTDNGNGTYSASFTGTATGTELAIGATIDGFAVTTAKPGLTVYTTGLTLSTDSLPAVATSGQAGAQQIVAIFANGAQRADGLLAQVTYTTPGIAACQSSNWLGTPSFDFTSANPVSLVSFTPNAAALLVYTCTATVMISSTTPGYDPKTFKVVLAVARGPVAQLAVNLIAMGDAGNSSVQAITPDARVTITNGGRGVISGIHATVIDATNNGDPDAWLTPLNLRWEPTVADTNQRTLPATLVVSTSVAPFDAEATIRITGNGITPIDIPVHIFFNIQPEVVANPRGLTFTAFPGGSTQQATVVAYNSNRNADGGDGLVDSLRAYERTPTPALPPWITSVTFTPILTDLGMDTASTVVVTINPAALLADSVYTDTVRIRAQECISQPDPDPCTLNGFRFNDYDLPVTVVVERGLVLSAADVTMFAAIGTTAVTRDVAITNGGARPISGLSADDGGASWLSVQFDGGTDAPTTLRLTANPSGYARGTVLSTTVTVNASTPTGVPTKSFPVTFRVY